MAPFHRAGAAAFAALASFSTPATAQVASASATAYFHFESGPVAPIRLTPDGERLLVLNSSDSRLEIWRIEDGDAGIELAFEWSVFTGLDPVAIAFDPEDASRCFVANELSDSVAVVDLDAHVVIANVNVGDEPHDVAVAGGKLFVACARARIEWTPGATSESVDENVVVVWDLASPAHAPQLTVVPIAGHTPRALEVSADGASVYVAPQNSGNGSSVLDLPNSVARGPRQEVAEPGEVFDLNPALASPVWAELDDYLRSLNPPSTFLGAGWAIPQAGRIVDGSDQGASFHPADHDVFVLDVASLAVVGQIDHVAGTLLALERRPDSGDELWVAGTTGRNTTRFEPVLHGNPMQNVVVRLDGSARTVEATYELAPPLTEGHHGQPVALAFDTRQRDGRVFIATLGTSSIVALDPSSGQAKSFAAGDLPQGLAFDEQRGLLFVFSRGDGTVRAFAVDADFAPVLVQPLDYDPEPPIVRAGRRTLYGASAESGRGTGNASCASCHTFGHMDHVVWDLGNPAGGMSPIGAELHGFPIGQLPISHPLAPVNHPMKGPMMTQSLRGIVGDEPLHWRGDRNALQSFRGAFEGLLGGSGITPAEMQAYTTFVGTMAHRPNPYQPKERAYNGIAEAGRSDFGEGDDVGGLYSSAIPFDCARCHQADFDRGVFTGSAPFVNFDGEPQMFNPSLLRSVYEKNHGELTGFGSLHDGTRDGVRGFLELPGFNLLQSDPARFTAMVEFVNQFDTGVAPLVGQQLLATSDNVVEARAWLDRAEAAARGGQCDLIAKGWLWVGGLREPHGACYGFGPDGNPAWLIDNTGVITREEMLSLYVKPGIAQVQFTCVLPTHGRRLGIDQDEDLLLDFVESAGFNTDPSDPDTDQDGYTDAAEIYWLEGDPLVFDDRLEDSLPPSVTGHGSIFTFVRSSTIWAVVDEPSTIAVTVRDGTNAVVATAAAGDLRVLHALVVDGLPAGGDLEYQIVATDRNGNVSAMAKGEFLTAIPQLHFEDLTLSVDRQDGTTATVIGTLRVVDQLGDPVVGMPLTLVFEAAGTSGLGAWWDAFGFSITDGNGVATIEKLVADPAEPQNVTMSPIALGSWAPNDTWYVGTAGLFDATFFYEQAANSASYVTATVK